MSTMRWRGTLIYTGTVAAIGAAGIARFVVTPDAAPATASGIGTSDGQSSSSSSGTSSGSGSSGSSSSGSSGSSATDTTGGGTTTSDSVTVVGSVASTRYGNVQVSVTFQGSTITDVQTLQAPDRERESQQISARSVPVLAQEVLDAQSAQVDTVSGATYTSEGYRESVQSAIDQRG
ncbi:FMN-binding protein [Cellulomonas sp.]|uniref:FMN-binding protein n=1 Tax=Cellulomonas sp. TaxID=40001 RepID=UPI001B063430|nr:FMN-binding protein [Cellulomonas sp.]MBO9555014.1 FMN-binding protein [Cellulomonas sp.]